MLIYCAREGPERLGKPTGKLIPIVELARHMAMEASDARTGNTNHYPEQ